MKKSELDLQNLKTKTKEFFSGFLDNIRLHTDNFLMLVFLTVIAAWGFMFYNYAYKVSITEPEVTVSVLKIKTDRLNKVAADIKEKENIRESTDLSSIKNPFENDVVEEAGSDSGKISPEKPKQSI